MARWLWIVGVSVGCAEAELAPWEVELDGEGFLVDDLDEQLGERSRVRVWGEARWVPDGEPLTGASWGEASAEVVVVDPGEQVRVSWSDRTVQVLLWLDRQDLDDVIADDTVGWGGAGGPAVSWPAGFSVEIVDERPGERFVMALLDDAVEVGSWVPTAQVDQVWMEPYHRAEVEPSGQSHVLTGPIVDLPGGDVVADRVVDGARFAVEVTGEADGPWLPVRWTSRQRPWAGVHQVVEVRGWAHELDLSPVSGLWGYGASFGCGCGGFGIFGPPNVPADTPLRDGPDGLVVGRTLEETRVSFSGGWGRLGVDTPWGHASLWVDEAYAFDPI